MLTAELLSHRVRDGRVQPGFIDPAEPRWLALAEELLAETREAAGRRIGALEEALAARAGASAAPKLARGLVKLLLDRCEVAPADPSIAARRAEVLALAAGVLRALPDGASRAEYEARLQAALAAAAPVDGAPGPAERQGAGEAAAPEPEAFRQLERARAALYADLPGARRIAEVPALDARELLDRYNLAQVQGLLLHARSLTVRAPAPELVRLRRLLRWLRFCRLVAEVERDGETLTLSVEGPGAVLALHKRYGLQLATFAGGVPVLGRYTLAAEVTLRRGRPVRLELDERAPLRSFLEEGLGHLPGEVRGLADGLVALGLAVDPAPPPRHVGARGLCVPDLGVRRPDGAERVIELFHPWHRGPLARRLDELAARPDPALLLGVDRALLSDEALRVRIEAHPQVVLFAQVPSARRFAAAVRGDGAAG